MRNIQILLAILTLSLFAVACSKDKAKDDGKPTDATMAPEMKPDEAMTPPADMPAAPEGDMPAADMPAAPEGDMAATPPAADAEPKLVCTKLIPEELQKKHGLTEVKDAGPGAPPRVMNCPFKKDKAGYSINIVCPTWSESIFKTTMENGKKSMKGAKDIEGLGRMGYIGNISGINMLQAWDDDTMCYITMSGDDEAFMTALAKDYFANLKPETLQ